MAGYAASARLQGAVPHLAGALDRHTNPWLASDDASTGEPPWVADPLELVGRPLDERFADWMASIGETWSQVTFYLFDPESWR